MIDVNKITSVLAKLPDAALQQYAEMHKQDPFILPLAIEEANRRKEMRAAPQAMQGQQPHVNDQAVQAMLPEDTGIAQLPMQAPPITHAAHGGIISFAVGGVAGKIPTADEVKAAYDRWMAAKGPWYLPTPQAGQAAALEREYTDLLRAHESGKSTDRYIQQQRGVEAAPTADYAPNMAGDFGTPVSPAKPAPLSRTQQPPGAGLGAIPGVAGTPGAAPAAGPRTEQDFIALQKRAQTELTPADPAEAQIRELALDQERRAQEREALYESKLPKGKAHEGLEASLKKEEEAVPQKKEENLKMALINAGLGMMAGTSQYAMVNIGKGAQVGTEAYQRGLDKLEKAAERRQELSAKIEEVRRAEARGDAEKAVALRKDRDDAAAGIKKLQIDGIRSMTGIGAKAAENVVDNVRAIEQQHIANAGALERTRIDAQARLAASQHSVSAQENMLHIANLKEVGQNLRAGVKAAEERLKDPTVRWGKGEKERAQAAYDEANRTLAEVNAQIAKSAGINLPAPTTPPSSGVNTQGWGKPTVVKP